MQTHTSVEHPSHDPALAAARVVELTRAEAKLVFAHARTTLWRTVGAVLAGMLATSAAQAALLLCAFSPVLFASWSRSAVLLALLPSLCVTALGTFLAILALRSLRSIAGAVPAATR